LSSGVYFHCYDFDGTTQDSRIFCGLKTDTGCLSEVSRTVFTSGRFRFLEPGEVFGFLHFVSGLTAFGCAQKSYDTGSPKAYGL
jgi:hypothetical protein